MAIDDPVLAGFIAASVRLAIPILLAALGGMFSEKSGVLNIGLEGMMLGGAFVGFIASYALGNVWLGVLSAMLAGALFGLVLAWFAVTARANQVVVGIAFNLLMLGATAFFFRAAFAAGTAAPRITPFAAIDFGWLSTIPLLGPLLFQHDPLTYLTLALVAFSLVVMHHSTLGLAITAVGENPEAAETLGLEVVKIRYAAVMTSGALAALGGAFLSTASTGLFLDNMTAGRGYIALAILILGRRHPVGILFAALLFGGAEALQLRAQLLPIGVPLQMLIMLPYLLTIIVLAGFAGRGTAPRALGEPLPR